jgi:catechol 2,3-dioxygenase-like lactoylglutathione lyase family enzyme
MPLTLNRIGQIALAVRDVDKAEAFYRDVLRLRWLYRFGDLTFFDCSGVRLLLEKASERGELSAARRFTSAVRTLASPFANLNSTGHLHQQAPPHRAHGGSRPLDSVLPRPGRPYSCAYARSPEGLHPGIGRRDR